jgi:SAM-dependent methyltransferase
LGVANPDGTVREAMGPKFRQINQFIEVLRPLLAEAFAHGAPVPPVADPNAERPTGRTRRRAQRIAQLLEENRSETMLVNRPLTVLDMGCGKGYLTFATSALLEQMNFPGSHVTGIEQRSDLVAEGNRIALGCGFPRLHFQAGSIAATPLEMADVLIALHACDTATDDALARGIAAGARLLVVSPCCHKELRPQIVPPPMLAPALRHGILLEREAEFVTDALRAALLEWAGYDTKVFEFISTEHTAKNLMITAMKRRRRGHIDQLADRVRELAGHYGVRSQRLAEQLGFGLPSPAPAA